MTLNILKQPVFLFSLRATASKIYAYKKSIFFFSSFYENAYVVVVIPRLYVIMKAVSAICRACPHFIKHILHQKPDDYRLCTTLYNMSRSE